MPTWQVRPSAYWPKSRRTPARNAKPSGQEPKTGGRIFRLFFNKCVARRKGSSYPPHHDSRWIDFYGHSPRFPYHLPAASMAKERFISICDSSFSSSSSSLSLPDSVASSASSDDITDSANSSWGSSPPPMPHGNGGPLFHMKSLGDNLPARKRGLSGFFTGKSQSFTSLADVKCVEDLAKPEKKLKTSHSWESTVESSYDNQTTRSSISSAGSAKSMKIPRKASYGSKMGKKNGPLIPTNSCRLSQSLPKQIH